ncbi:MAG TPA: FIST N-terminal domain-containing protein [Candidatus Methanoperedens sp.]
MKSITLLSNRKDPKEAAQDIIEQVRSRLDFKPDLAMFYATLKYNGKYQSMLDIIHEELGDVPQIGASVDGMIFPDDIRTDGATLVLCSDPEAKITVQGAKEKSAIESVKKLARKINCEKGVVILHFPLAHVPNTLKFVEFCAKGFYYSERCKRKNQEEKKQYAAKFADYCDKENIFYIPPIILETFAKQTGYKVPIIGVNVLHTQARFNSPNIFCNFKDIEDGIAALSIEKNNINAIYDDIFPDKGKTLEETKDIVNKEFTIIKQFKASFNKNILVSLDGMPPVEAVKNLINVSEKNEEELVRHLDKGNYKIHMPYELLFYNKKTKGMFLLGMGNYVPFDLFPFFMDVSGYSDDVSLAYELIDDKFEAFISCFNNLKYNNGKFVYFCIDIGVTTAFGDKVFEYKDKIKELVGNNYFGILSTTPSAYIPPEFQLRNYLSESISNTFFMSAGTNTCLEI